jgi:hypothetical protein
MKIREIIELNTLSSPKTICRNHKEKIWSFVPILAKSREKH